MWIRALLYFLGAVFGLMIFSDIMMLLKLSKLKVHPRVKVFYLPRLLQFILVSMAAKDDLYTAHKNEIADVKDKDFIVMPSVVASGRRSFIPKSAEAITQYYKLETENFARYNILGDNTVLNLLFSSNEEGLTRRAFFSKLFHIENMKKMLPGMRKIVKDHINTLKEKVLSRAKEGDAKTAVVDVREELMVDLIDDISSYLVLGQTSRNSIRVQGESYVKKTKELFDHLTRVILSPYNMFTFGLARKLGLDPIMNNMKRLNADLFKASIAEYKRVFNETEEAGEGSERNNVISLIVRHNKEAQVADGGKGGKDHNVNQALPNDKIVDMILGFLFAGSDTSFNSTTSTLSLLAQNPEISEKLRTELFKDPKIQSSEYAFEDLDSKPYLSACMKEALRLVTPAPTAFHRVATKPTTLCGVTLEKGDIVQVSYLSQSRNPAVFKNSSQFNPDRFMRQGECSEYPKIQKTQFFPFSLGKRNCQGKNLAEMILKTILTEFLREFNFKQFVGDKTKFATDPGYSFGDNRIQIELR